MGTRSRYPCCRAPVARRIDDPPSGQRSRHLRTSAATVSHAKPEEDHGRLLPNRLSPKCDLEGDARLHESAGTVYFTGEHLLSTATSPPQATGVSPATAPGTGHPWPAMVIVTLCVHCSPPCCARRWRPSVPHQSPCPPPSVYPRERTRPPGWCSDFRWRGHPRWRGHSNPPARGRTGTAQVTGESTCSGRSASRYSRPVLVMCCSPGNWPGAAWSPSNTPTVCAPPTSRSIRWSSPASGSPEHSRSDGSNPVIRAATHPRVGLVCTGASVEGAPTSIPCACSARAPCVCCPGRRTSSRWADTAGRQIRAPHLRSTRGQEFCSVSLLRSRSTARVCS